MSSHSRTAVVVTPVGLSLDLTLAPAIQTGAVQAAASGCLCGGWGLDHFLISKHSHLALEQVGNFSKSYT